MLPMNLIVIKSIVIAIFLTISFSSAIAQEKKTVVSVPAEIEALLKQHTCFACHKVDARLVGPAYTDVAAKNYKDEQMVDLIYNPKPANWPGYPPMTPMKHVPKADALKIAKWINSLNKKGKPAAKK